MQVITTEERPSRPRPDPHRTTASAARRAQIVGATTEVIASAGLAGTTFARIARQADLSSTRLISYHFAGKDELIEAVVEDVLARMGSYVGERIDAAEDETGPGNAEAILRAYIAGSVAFIDSHRPQVQALMQIVLASGGLPGHAAPSRGDSPLEGLLRHGQSTGEFRLFDVTVVGQAVQRAIEGLPFLLAAQPDLDCARYGTELVDLYLRGVRAER